MSEDQPSRNEIDKWIKDGIEAGIRQACKEFGITPPPPKQEREIIFGVDANRLRPGSRLELNGRAGTVTYVDTKNLDQETGYPVILVDWDDI